MLFVKMRCYISVFLYVFLTRCVCVHDVRFAWLFEDILFLRFLFGQFVFPLFVCHGLLCMSVFAFRIFFRVVSTFSSVFRFPVVFCSSCFSSRFLRVVSTVECVWGDVFDTSCLTRRVWPVLLSSSVDDTSVTCRWLSCRFCSCCLVPVSCACF